MQWLLGDASTRNATAVHLDLEGDGLCLRYRVGDTLESGPHLQRAAGNLVCQRILETTTELAPRGAGAWEGTFDTDVDAVRVIVRVSVVSTKRGSHVVLRPAVRRTDHARLEDLGLDAVDAGTLRRLLHGPDGLVVVCAPTAGLREAVAVVAAREIGTDDRLVALVRGDGGVEVPGAIEPAPRVSEPAVTHCVLSAADRVTAAMLLDAHAIVIAATGHAATTRVAFDAAAHRELVVLVVEGDDPVVVVTDLAELVGEVLVAGTLAAVVVWSGSADAPSASLHVVTDEVRHALLGDESVAAV